MFDATGGLHAAGLFDNAGNLLAVREDVGRHNALDKLVGWALMEGKLPLHEHIVLVSGRVSFELVQKCLAAGVPIVCAISAPSSLAVSLAAEFGMTLIGFLRGDRFNIYTGANGYKPQRSDRRFEPRRREGREGEERRTRFSFYFSSFLRALRAFAVQTVSRTP